jgi:hypothetical protein
VGAASRSGNQVRDLLKDFYPAALVAFAGLPEGGLARADARTVLAAAPTPTQAATLTTAGLRRLLVTAGRKRKMDGNAIVQGWAGVYSSFLLHAERAAERYGVPAQAILARCGELQLVGGQEDMIIDIALELRPGA